MESVYNCTIAHGLLTNQILEMLSYILEARNTRMVRILTLGLLIGAISLEIVYLVNVFSPFARLTTSSPANTAAALLFCVFLLSEIFVRFRRISTGHPWSTNLGIDAIISLVGLLCLIDSICWLVNPVIDMMASLVSLLNSLLVIGFCLISFYFWKRIRAVEPEEIVKLNIQNSMLPAAEQPKPSACWTVVSYIFHLIFLLFVILYTCQVVHEAVSPKSLGEGEKFYTVKSNGASVKVRTFCLGDQNLPQVILEAGGGSSGIDFYKIQQGLKQKYRVCSYDRAGYGKSYQGPSPQSMEHTMELAEQVMSKVGFPVNEEKSIICIGHSVGGQLCRYYAKHLKSIKAVILLDSVPVMNWFYIDGKCGNQSADQIYSQQLSKGHMIKFFSLLWPYYFGTPFLKGKNFDPPELLDWQNWQITTTRNWYAQSLGSQAEIEECGLECMQQSIVKEENMLQKPIVAITASNHLISCEDRNLTGKACDDYICGRDATIQLSKDQASLGNGVSTYEECEGICDHDFVWKKADYLVQRIEYYIPQF